MNRILIIAVIGLAALSFGLAGALVKTRSDARGHFAKLEQEIETRTTFGGRRGGDNGDGSRGPRGNANFGQVAERLDLNDAQKQVFRAFFNERRSVRRSLSESIRGKEADFHKALKSDEFDRAAIKALRKDLQTMRLKGNDEVFEAFEDFLESLSLEQRTKMLELSKRSPNALLFL